MNRITTDVDAAVECLTNGGIVGMPTETVYGLAALVHQPDAVGRVFAVKGRPTSHPLIVHLSPDADPTLWGLFDHNAARLADAFWPGPLTLLIPRTSLVPDWVTGGRDTVAIRVPSHPLTQQLLSRVHDGVVAPSANRFGMVSPTTAQHVLDDLGDDVDLILDGGPCAVGVESTIVECIDGAVTILRPGGIGAEEIASQVNMVRENQHGESRAPGMLASHYAPRTPLRLVDTLAEAQQLMSEMSAGGESCMLIHHDNEVEYALHLYDDLRSGDRAGVDYLIAVMPLVGGLGDAVRDRLRKASA